MSQKPTAKSQSFDVVVIGSGSAGFAAAEAARLQGARVCVVEKEKWGGECPNFACIPAKSLINSAKAFHFAKHRLPLFGVKTSAINFSYPQILGRKQAIVKAITGNGRRLVDLANNIGINTVKGTAKFINARTIKVGQQKIKAKSFVIATGSVDFIPPIDGIKTSGLIGYKEVANLSKMPDSIVIIGAGPVGCEYATFFGLLGAKVTLLELSSQILINEDSEIAAIVQSQLQGHGVTVHTKTKTLSVQIEDRQKKVTFQVGRQKRQTVLADQVLLAAGKVANLQGLNIEKAGVKVDNRGRLKVKSTLQTTVDNIYAAGDVSGGLRFTHVAYYEGHIAGTNAAQSTKKKKLIQSSRVVPRVTFALPEVASVGMTAEEAIKQGYQISIGKFSSGALGRAITEGEQAGLVKLIVDKKTRKILGGHIAGPCAGELVHEIALAMYANLTVDDLANMIHAFPTYSEAITAAASMV
ncbi:MAG: dihydrolipoyl dehydrogenase [Patescibacteria group bacterium]